MKDILKQFDDIMYAIIQPNIDVLLFGLTMVLITLIIFRTKDHHYPGLFKDLPDEY
jgi:hypothetical protein